MRIYLLQCLLRVAAYRLQCCRADVNPRSSSSEAPRAQLSTVAPSGSNSSIMLPPWEEIFPIAKLYLEFCESQPLPLFHRPTFIPSLQTRDVEIIYAILALALRFSDSYEDASLLTEMVNGYAEVARGLVMKRVSEGPVELSTLQCLCLLSLVDFTSKQGHDSID